MILLNWLPELFLLSLLFISLILINFRIWTYRSLSVCIAIASGVELFYLLLRPDLAFFDSPLKIVFSDSLSNFGKILALVALIIFSLGFHFHRKLNFQSKQSSNLFLIFYSLFVTSLFQANNLVLFLGSAIGLYFCSSTLVLIESGQRQSWVRTFRQRALPIAFWMAAVSILFVLGTDAFGSIYLSDWISALSKNNSLEIEYFIMGFLILITSAVPLGGLLYRGSAPLGLGVLYYSLFLVFTAFWLRLGIPFFSNSQLLPKMSAQILISILLGSFTFRHAVVALKTRQHHDWYASALPTVVGLSMFLILLSGEHALPAFYCISLSVLATFGLISHAFLDEEYHHKGFLVFSCVALVGAPPLILGEQLYRLIHNAVGSGNWVAGIMMFASWFILSVAVTQMIAKVLLVRIHFAAQRKLFFSEYFFMGTYLACVITLTAFRMQIVTLLNEHPIHNLW